MPLSSCAPLAEKFGVETDEFDDGIVIFGTTVDQLRQGASVHCYDDHRVAMAFSVLAIVCPETVIEERRCVEKTWPNWWDDLENKVRRLPLFFRLACSVVDQSGPT